MSVCKSSSEGLQLPVSLTTVEALAGRDDFHSTVALEEQQQHLLQQQP
jgi:hypothetical protein